MICIFPFEQEFYAQHGLDVDYVGHPLVDTVHPRFSREEFFRQHGLDPEAPLVALLPGSRHREIYFHLETMLEAARLLRAQRTVQFVLPVAGTLNVAEIREKVPPDLRACVHVIEGDSYYAAAHARCAVVSSGTATVETALLGTPMVVIYRLSDWTYRLGKNWVKTPFYAMVNLILGEAAVPELIQDEFYPAAIVDWAGRLLDDTVEREAQIVRLLQVRQRLGAPGAMERAALAVERALFPPGEPADLK
jgi:lipid-A-disaccharide synthase